MENSPASLVDETRFVPITLMLAPASATPCRSVTLPEIRDVCWRVVCDSISGRESFFGRSRSLPRAHGVLPKENSSADATRDFHRFWGKLVCFLIMDI